MLSDLEQIRWDDFAQPSGNEADALPSALRALAATTERGDFSAYHRLLCAIGNNHAGTYFPVALPAIPVLIDILGCAPLADRLQTLEVLADLLGSFGPEPGFEQVVTPQGQGALRQLIKEAACDRVADIERCRAKAETAEEAKFAEEVLSLLQE